MPNPLRIGILGAGNIARQFAAGVRASERCALAAIGSRSVETGAAFASQFDVPFAGDYAAAAHSSAVDAVYIALPNSMHHEWTLRCLAAGKHVLCEKPFAANAAQAAEMFDAARQSGLRIMEAFMYRSHPQTLAVAAAAAAGAVGKVRHIRSSFCYRTTRTDTNIRFDPALAGGALMDVGCYCINFSRFIAGAEPVRIHATGQLHERGVDVMCAGMLEFPSLIATFTCGMNLQANNAAYINGDEAFIEVPVPWKPPAGAASYAVIRAAPPRMDGGTGAVFNPRQTVAVECGRDLYALEVDDFAAAVSEGAPMRISESDTLGNMRVLDEMRRQLGVDF